MASYIVFYFSETAEAPTKHSLQVELRGHSVHMRVCKSQYEVKQLIAKHNLPVTDFAIIRGTLVKNFNRRNWGFTRQRL